MTAKRWYLDTSAAIKLAHAEDETAALVDAVNHEKPVLVSSELLITEMHRARLRLPSLTQGATHSLLRKVSLSPVTTEVLRFAGNIEGQHLRSLDAIHIAAALLGGAPTLITYDNRMAESARAAGLEVLQPGR